MIFDLLRPGLDGCALTLQHVVGSHTASLACEHVQE